MAERLSVGGGMRGKGVERLSVLVAESQRGGEGRRSGRCFVPLWLRFRDAYPVIVKVVRQRSSSHRGAVRRARSDCDSQRQPLSGV